MNNGMPNQNSYTASPNNQTNIENNNPVAPEVEQTPPAPVENLSVPNTPVEPIPVSPAPSPITNDQTIIMDPINNVNPSMDSAVIGNVGDQTPNIQPMNQLDQNPDLNNVMGLDPLQVEPKPVNENIGIIPPEKQKKGGGAKKVLFTFLILILIGSVAYGVYYYLNMGNTATSTSVTTKAVKSPINENLSTDINQYASFSGIKSDECELNTADVDTSAAGSYDFTIICGANSYKGKIEIVDESKPEVVLIDVYKEIGEEVEPAEFIESCSKEECTYEFAEDTHIENLTKEGNGLTEVEIIVTDNSGIENTIKANLIVTENAVFAFLKATGDEMDMDDYTGTYVVNDYIGIDSDNNYTNYAYRVYEYTFTNEDEFLEVVEDYTGKTSFNDLAGTITFNHTNKIMMLKSPLTTETLDIEYGGKFPTTYSQIRSYYQGEGYSTQTATK